MRDAAREALAFISGRGRDDLDGDRQLVLALVTICRLFSRNSTKSLGRERAA
jgi:hypothetical protein